MCHLKHGYQQEIELKYRFHDAKTFNRVKKAAINLSATREFVVLKQANYFFDTADFDLREHSLSIRLRSENKNFILCIKGNDPNALKNQKGISIKLEYEECISKEVAHQLLKHQRSPLDSFQINSDTNDDKKEKTCEFLRKQIQTIIKNKPLQLVGSFTNERTCIPICIHENEFLLEIDETTFKPNLIHYEVELEIEHSLHQAKAERFLFDLFQQAKASFFPSNGKAERFYQLLMSNEK